MTSGDAPSDTSWKRCNICKEPIAYAADYYVCSVSTCNRVRTGLSFCSVACWDAHLPFANHREAWAEEARAPGPPGAAPRPPTGPKRTAAASSTVKPRQGTRRIVSTPAAGAANPPAPKRSPDQVLVIASRLKEFISAESGFNTSDRVLEPLSDIVRRVCREAIRNAERDERKTVLDRDIPKS